MESVIEKELPELDEKKNKKEKMDSERSNCKCSS